MSTQVTDTHRRAKLRSREAEAQWRIKSGVWAGRLYTVLFVALSIAPLLSRGGPDWISTIVLLVFAAGLLFSTERMRKGSRAAAVAVLAIVALTKLADWLLFGAPWYAGALWTVIIVGALVNGVWGTMILAEVRRDAASIPPAPARPGMSQPTNAHEAR
jgi:hypothetical protein